MSWYYRNLSFFIGKFANNENSWFNLVMKNLVETSKKNTIFKHFQKGLKKNHSKSSNINVLLNRIKLDNKNEKRKKLYFSAAASTGLILFGLIIF